MKLITPLYDHQKQAVEKTIEKEIRKHIHGDDISMFTICGIETLSSSIRTNIRHNRARGTHQIRSMSDIVVDLTKEGWSEEEICKKLGMELDEVIRLKQISGLKEAFQNHEFSKSWEEFESKYYPKGGEQ